MICWESMLEFDETGVTVMMVHDHTVNYIFHRFTDTAGM